jgi:hypothetical protein
MRFQRKLMKLRSGCTQTAGQSVTCACRAAGSSPAARVGCDNSTKYMSRLKQPSAYIFIGPLCECPFALNANRQRHNNEVMPGLWRVVGERLSQLVFNRADADDPSCDRFTKLVVRQTHCEHDPVRFCRAEDHQPHRSVALRLSHRLQFIGGCGRLFDAIPVTPRPSAKVVQVVACQKRHQMRITGGWRRVEVGRYGQDALGVV